VQLAAYLAGPRSELDPKPMKRIKESKENEVYEEDKKVTTRRREE
jgi:hypothetical protein